MNKLTENIMLFITGLYLGYSVFITTPTNLNEMLSWGYISILALLGWSAVYNKSKDDKK